MVWSPKPMKSLETTRKRNGLEPQTYEIILKTIKRKGLQALSYDMNNNNNNKT